MDRAELVSDLMPFSDIGESGPKVTEQAGKLTARMLKDGRPLKIVLDANGHVQCTWGTNVDKGYSSFGTMLASEIFSNLRRWSESQRELLRSNLDPKKMIPISGQTNDGRIIEGINNVNELLIKSTSAQDQTSVLVIDGPAGIGKTILIEQLAFQRASQFRETPQPLILHVKSRGRVLSNLQDLMAFSLQTLRSSTTYDQLPILAKYGLVTIAIDGFDELGDPNGYELAWGQVGDLVSSIRGKGSIIMAGRETFIGRDRLMRDVSALREGIDTVVGLTLGTPTTGQAKAWLKQHQWHDEDFKQPAVMTLLEDKSYALRPVFLKLMADFIKPKQLRDKPENHLTPLLMNQMMDREAGLFGRNVDKALTREGVRRFVGDYVCEIAREMADYQTEALDEPSLALIAEASIPLSQADEVVALIKNRAAVIAFLTTDERPGYRRFIHSHLMSYFLAHVTAQAISKGDIAKFVRRNIFGSEFLLVFGDVISELSEKPDTILPDFFKEACRFLAAPSHRDRAARNIAALMLSALPNSPSTETPQLIDLQIDDAVIRGTCSPAVIHNAVISQLDVRAADLSLITFNDTSIVTVIANNATIFSTSFPNPAIIVDENSGQITDATHVRQWIDCRGRKPAGKESRGIVPEDVRNHNVYKLLGKVCRFRQHWLREDGDDHAARILNSPDWELLAAVLRQFGFLREEVRPASGRPSKFSHIRHTDRLLAEDENDQEIVSFFIALQQSITH